MIEAMACGTPVLAFRNGSVAEVVEAGLTGEIVDSVSEAICKMGSVLALDRGRVRRRFEQRFTAARMARDYTRIYEKLATGTDLIRDLDRPSPTIDHALEALSEVSDWKRQSTVIQPFRHRPEDTRGRTSG